MPITWTDDALNAQADGTFTLPDEVSIHTGDPGVAGTLLEATGGSPAYARQDPLWEPAGDEGPLGAGIQPATVGIVWGAPSFDLPPGTYTHFAFWLGSTFLGSGPLSNPFVAASQTTYTPNMARGPGPTGVGV